MNLQDFASCPGTVPLKLVCLCKQAEAIWPPETGKRTALQLIWFCPMTRLICCAFRLIGHALLGS